VSVLILRGLIVLLSLEPPLRRRNFAEIYDRVRRAPVSKASPPADALERVCAAVDDACLWYWKQVLCLQRSAATVLLLRKRGIPAKLVIGAQHMPFKAHAWVEVAGQIVNDRSYMSEMYCVLDRC
jgi:hypothetical protein